MSGPILSVRNLTKVFSRPGQADLVAVNHIRFDLAPGECLGLIGESGSGKSTVANLIARLLDATEGEITLAGEDITRARGAALKRIYRAIQMVFQSPRDSFDPRRTLGDGIGESLENSGMPAAAVKREVGRLLPLCGLPADFAGRYPHEVSGGQCQRAAIARAIAIQPKVLLCDEATAALDVTVQAEIMALFRQRIRETGMACLFICHDIALAQDFCDRLLVMYRGAIVEEGTPDEVIRAPKEKYTKLLIESVL